ncbi:MAG: hypothetical protein EBX52_14230, partial [Proteobacteria bacterium]|nr:hypothetical protein [Pseudomonadota bacterium]
MTVSAHAETHLLIKSKMLLESANPMEGLAGWQSIRIPDREKLERIRELSQDPRVEWVEEDQRYSVDPAPASGAPRLRDSRASALRGANVAGHVAGP